LNFVGNSVIYNVTTCSLDIFLALFEEHPLMPQRSGCLTSPRFRPASRLTFETLLLLMSVFLLTAA